MKKIIIALVVLFAFFGCSKDDPKEYYSFENRTNYKVKVKPIAKLLDGAPDFEFIINANESKTYESEYMYGIFEVTSTETTRNFDYKFSGDTRVIYSFGKMVEYKITGTAKSVDLTYSSSKGSTVQKTVNLPYTVSFDYFSNDFKYISAQNNTNIGSVKVELYIMDGLVSNNTCASAYCIATAHN